MKHYRRNHSGNDRVKKIMFRILFVLIAAAVITFGSIFLGNYLLYKIGNMEAAEEAGQTDDSSASSELHSGNVGDNYSSPDIFGASIVLSEYSGEDEAVLAVNTLSQTYDTILLHVNDSEGMLTYTSPALCSFNRMPAPEDNPRFRLFASAAAAVKAQNKRLCVLLSPNFLSYDPASASAADGALIEEMALYGVDEILIRFPEQYSLTERIAEDLHDYIISCREASDDVCPIGILLSCDHYLDENEIMQVETLADAASFLAISYEADENTALGPFYRRIARSLTTLLGSFNVYNMRIHLGGSNKHLAAAYEACQKADMDNICFMSYVLPDDLVYVSQPEETEEIIREEPADPSLNTNPYTTIPETETETETEAPAEILEPVNSPGETPWY